MPRRRPVQPRIVEEVDRRNVAPDVVEVESHVWLLFTDGSSLVSTRP
jgi:hypothetical protein